jgi:hypothetical protein
MLNPLQKIPHHGLQSGKTVESGCYFRGALHKRTRTDIAGAMFQEAPDNILRYFQMKLKAENPALILESLMLAPRALRSVDASRRESEGIPMPMERLEPAGECAENPRGVAAGGQTNRKPADFPMAVPVYPRPENIRD